MVEYSGVEYHLVPAPLVNFEKQFQRTANGSIIGVGYSVTLNGNILPNKGHPIASGSNGSFSTSSWTTSISPDDDPVSTNYEPDVLSATIAKQQKIQQLFASGTSVPIRIYGYGQSSGISFVGNVESITFPEDGRWALPSNYTISLSTNYIDGQSENFAFAISDASESWSIEESDQISLTFNNYTLENPHKVYNVSHNLNAVGKPVYNTDGSYNGGAPWQQASGYVRSVLGLGTGEIPVGIFSPLMSIGSGYAFANRKIQENVDELAGSYGITETFLAYHTGVAPFPVLEEFNVSQDTSEESIQTVQVQGTIKGLDSLQNSNMSNRNNAFFNASGFYNIIQSHVYNRVLGVTQSSWIHPIPLAQSISKNPNEGTVTYSFTYNDRPPNIISGSRTEDISINDTYPGQNFAVHNVIGQYRPVIQYLNSNTEYRRQLNIDIRMNRLTNNWGVNASGGYWTNVQPTGIRNWLFQQKPSVISSSGFKLIFDAANPANDSGVIQSKVFYTAPQESWNPKTGAYTYTIEWTYIK